MLAGCARGRGSEKLLSAVDKPLHFEEPTGHWSGTPGTMPGTSYDRRGSASNARDFGLFGSEGRKSVVGLLASMSLAGSAFREGN